MIYRNRRSIIVVGRMDFITGECGWVVNLKTLTETPINIKQKGAQKSSGLIVSGSKFY